MLLSIITINLNNSIGLEKTIKSVIEQSFKNYEFIIIDGQSTDESVDIIKKHSDHIHYWVSEKDNGIYNAMNKGIRLSQGKYCLFLNSGDILCHKTILKQLFFNQFSEDIVSCGLELHSETYKGIQLPPLHVSLLTFTGGSLAHPATLIKKELLNSLGGYHENYKIISDWCFFVEALIITKCSYKSFDIILSSFDCCGISSTAADKETNSKKLFLEEKFSRIIENYDIIGEESVTNTLYWINQKGGILKIIFTLQCKILNRILHLRNRLRIRIGAQKL